MRLIRVLLPASWTIAHADDMGGDKSGDMKKEQEEVEEEGQRRHGRRQEGGHGQEVVHPASRRFGRANPDDRTAADACPFTTSRA
jgi:hypothetical protein